MATPRAAPMAAAASPVAPAAAASAAAAPRAAGPPAAAAAAAEPPQLTTTTSPSFPPGTAHVDGSMLEGGGQILRNSVALSGVLGLPIAVTSIRAGRAKPGLSPQHATGLRLAARICGGGGRGGQGAGLEGCEPRSTAVRFAPAPWPPVAGEGYEADTGTAGSCTLLVQQALPLLLFARRRRQDEEEKKWEGGGAGAATDAAAAAAAPGRKRERDGDGDGGDGGDDGDAEVWSRVVMRGGTDASHAPPVGYLQRVLAPTLNAWLADPNRPSPPISVSLARRGFYPRGGGEAALRVCALPPGASLPPLAHLSERARVVCVDVYAFSAGRVPPDAARRAAEGAAGPIRAALAALAEQAAAAAAGDQGDPSKPPPPPPLPPPVRLHTEHLAPGSGLAVGDSAGVTCVASTSVRGQLLGSSASGERGLRAEDMGAACGRALARQLCSGCAADEWLADQVVVLAALAGGTSRVLCAAPLSLHARTAVAVAEQLTAAWAAARARRVGNGQEDNKNKGAVFRLVPVDGSRERAAEAARRAGFKFEAGEPGSEGLVLLECDGVGAKAGG